LAVDKNFVVKNGLEVNTDLILADANTNQVGIATTNPRYTLHVNGGIGATDAYVTGIATVATDLVVGGTLTANASAGSTGQYLKSTSTGVEWASFPTLRTSTFFTATAGQSAFSFAYTVGFLDVFVNGVKLADSEVTATDGITVNLNNPCFGGEIVEIIGYSTVGIGVGGTGIGGITVKEEGVVTGTTGGVTSINFVGAAVTAVGTGAGVTVYITGGSGGGGGESYWAQTAAGIHTLSNVGVGTTNPRFALEVGAVGASGTSLWVNGNARVTGILTIGTSSIVLDGSANTINVGSGVTIEGDTGILRASEFYADGVQVGIITADTIIYQGVTLEQNLWVSNITGIHTSLNVAIGTDNAVDTLTVQGDASISGDTNLGNQLYIGQSGDIQYNQPDLEIRSTYTGGKVKLAAPSGVEMRTYGTSQLVAYFASNPGNIGYVDLYYDGSKKFETTNAGVKITGTVTASEFIGAASSVTVLANNSSATTHYVGFFTNTSGSNNILSDSTLQYVPSTNTLTAGTFDGNISANNVTSGTLDNARLPANVSISGNLSVAGVSTFSYIKNTGITSTRDLIIYGDGNESGSISTVALMSRNNYIDFGPAIPYTSAPQQFALRLGSDRAPGTFGVYNILGASYAAPSGSVFLNNWDGTSAISISDNGVFVTPKPLIVGTATSTGTASQTLQVTGGAYVSGSVGIGTTNPTSKLTVEGDVSVSGFSNFIGNVRFANSTGVSTYVHNIGPNYIIGYDTSAGYENDIYIKFSPTTSNYILPNVGIGTTNPTSALTVQGDANVSGVVTATTFVGDGSGLTGIVGSGSGVVILDDGATVGTAGTIDFGTNLSVSPISAGVVTVTSPGVPLQSRTIVTGVTTSIANNGIGNTNITGFKSYALMKVGLSTAGWLRLYTDSASRDADVSRSVGIDPTPGSGVIAEVVTTGISTTQIISPFVMGGNLDDPADTTIYAAITNLSGSTQAITANLTILQLEA